MPGFRFVLELPDGDVADPAMFVTAVPNWKEVTSSSRAASFNGSAFSIHADLDPPASEFVEAVWIVEPVEK